MIIPESERSPAPLVGEKVFSHPDMVRANEYVLHEYTPPVRNVCIFVPCAKVKPYHTSPSHRNYDKVIFSVLAPEEVHILSLIHISEPTRRTPISYAVFCLKKKKTFRTCNF